ncbi:MAG: proteasome accessory factor PafA2 family protein [Fimbriimonadaceae bacterium]
MARPRSQRIYGLETEFGCLVEDEASRPEIAVEIIKDAIFTEMRLGALDIHSRDEVFEPAESGGFLINGARLYIDAVGSHLEYATAECQDLKTLVANDRAGQRQIVRALEETGLRDTVNVYNNSVDHFGGHTFGCHEDFFTGKVAFLYPFLVTRQIFSGVGRVGGHILFEGGRPDYADLASNPVDYIWVSNIYNVQPDPDVEFQLSQRADHILKTVASRVRFNRALVNPKWEHFYSHDGMHRLHLLFGEANQNQFAYALKVGTTSLVLALIEDELVPEELLVAQPLTALRQVSRDPDWKWPVRMLDGSTMGAVDLQREYLKLAERYREDSEDAAWILDQWAAILDGLESDPMALGDRIDWVAKRKIVEMYRESERLEWSDDALHSIDLEYHNIDPQKSLFQAYQATEPVRDFVDDLDITDAMTDPPTNTRALGRSKLVQKVVQSKKHDFYMFDWSGASLGRDEHIELHDPFETYADVT